MRVILDTCMWHGVRDILVAAGHDVVWAGDWPADPGDYEILEFAHRDGRVLFTLDKDFGELAVALRRPHNGIVRLVGWRTGQQALACQGAITRYADELARGAIVTMQPGRWRVRLPTGD